MKLIILLFAVSCAHYANDPNVRILRDNNCYTLRGCTEEMSEAGIKICKAEGKVFKFLTTSVDGQGTYMKFKCE